MPHPLLLHYCSVCIQYSILLIHPLFWNPSSPSHLCPSTFLKCLIWPHYTVVFISVLCSASLWLAFQTGYAFGEMQQGVWCATFRAPIFFSYACLDAGISHIVLLEDHANPCHPPPPLFVILVYFLWKIWRQVLECVCCAWPCVCCGIWWDIVKWMVF